MNEIELQDKLNENIMDFSDIVEELVELYAEKNRRYGDSFSNQFKEFGIICSAIRLNDKMERLKSLVKNPQDCGDEPIEDTLKDMANYAIMTLIELKRKN